MPSLSDEVDCWCRSEFFWRMRASLDLACAQAATLCTQVVGKPPLVGHERGAPRARTLFNSPFEL